MLELFLESQIQEDGILDTVVFQQDGPPPHLAQIVCDYLNRTFPGRRLVRGSSRVHDLRHLTLPPYTLCTEIHHVPGVHY